MKPLPIPLSARDPVEYIPYPQDVTAFLLNAAPPVASLTAELAALREQPAQDGERIQELESLIADLEKKNRDAAEAIRARYPRPMTFLLYVPTSTEREQINSRLISLGLAPINQEQIRATLIEELFEQDWGKGSPEANEIEAEDLANFLDGYWQRQEAHDAAITRWQEQEVQRVLDQHAGAPVRPREELPPKIISVRENAKATNLIDRMMRSSQKLRDLAAKSADFNRVNAILLVRTHVLAATNVDVELAQDPRTRALPEEQALALREEMDDASWHDLVARINRMYFLDGDEEKNSVSPLEKPSVLSGSPAQNDDTAISGGSSTVSSIAPLPADGSATIIAPSSTSTFASGATLITEAASPTESPSLTSP